MERRYWHLGNYQYAYYGYVLEQTFQKHNLNIVLDAGCGKRGSVQTPIKHLVGVDVSRSNIKVIRKSKSGDFIVADLTHLPFKSEVFDTVVSKDVLEHVLGKELVFAEIARVSRHGAHFVGSTSNELNPFMLLDSQFPAMSGMLVKYVGEYYERHSRLNLGTLTKIMSKTGFNFNISLFGLPQFQPWLYEYSNKNVPWFGSLWIIFDKLTRQISILKEIIVFDAVKK